MKDYVLIYIIFAFIAGYFFHSYTNHATSSELVKEQWTLFNYDSGGEFIDAYNYSSFSDCWNAAVASSNRGTLPFSCGLNCGDNILHVATDIYKCERVCKAYPDDEYCKSRILELE